ncbi:hypothetical protein MLD38_028932 [Melastoma candidum]|uniref:Uncharacterized protein n=1 Tax=Melastoma candidum TaxID=119954 RepID=A0ACB9N2K5_9MYRT|nr:hypothetical protein MLD38_028932 [Melastoma candidum]
MQKVIEAGGREYRFTWSREFGELCDIYEETQRGVDGTGLLVESGSAWRKINVQRVLDESTKKHVKMRSEEAAKISKSRKAIVLEPGNPSMKSQIKQLAAVEVNPRRMHFLQKKEPPSKKQKVGPSSVSLNGPSKPTLKPGSSLPAKPFAKGNSRLSASPLPSPSHQSGAIVSPYKMESTSHRNVVADDATRSHPVSKDSAATFQREPSKGSQERLGPFDQYGDRPMDLRNSLIRLLKENPKGMSFEALENATGGTITASGKKIEPILKKITTYQPPGRYLLKSGVELDSFQRPSPGSGSSPEDNQNLEPSSELNAVKSPSTDGGTVEKIEVHAPLAESNFSPGPHLDASENIDIERNSPDNFGNKKESENSEGQARSSSDSGSDSDSDSESHSSDSRSDSGSPSGSRSRTRSRSRSQAGSGSSSDSDSDASSNSRQGSDVDVDITPSDDEKVHKPKLQNSGPGFASPVVGRFRHDSGDEHQDGHASDIVDKENDFVDTAPSVEEKASEEQGLERVSEEFHRFSPDENELFKRQHFIGSLFDERQPAFKESSKCERSSNNEKNPSKSGRGEPQHTDMKSEMTKKLNADSMTQTSTPEGSKPEHHFGSRGLSPVKFSGSVYESPLCQTVNNAEWDTFKDVGFQKSHNQVTSGKSSSSSQQTGRRSSDKGLQLRSHDSGGKNSRHADSINYGSKVKQKRSDFHEGIRMQKENFGQDDFTDSLNSEKVLRGMREGSGDKDLMSIVAEPVQPKRSELVAKSKEMGHNTVSHPGPSRKGHDGIATDKGPGGRGPIIQRELSDLELGELREPVLEVTAPSKQFERNRDSLKFDSSRGKPLGKASLDPGKIPAFNTSAKIQSMLVSSRKRPLEQRDDNQPVSHLESQRPSRVDSSEVNLPIKDLSKLAKNEAGAMIGLTSEETGNNLKVPSVNGVHRFDPKWGLTSQIQKESRLQNCNNAATSVNRQKDLDSQALQRVRESSSDNSSCSYTKFEKDKPELKGRIKDFSQYKEYIQEYKDKYESYRSLNKILENYRNQFQKIGNDLESARGRGDIEKYNKILARLRDSYRKCGSRHKRLKKIFLVLHEELEHLKRMIREFVATHSKD